MTGRRWGLLEIKKLKREWSSKIAKQLSQELGRKPVAIEKKALDLGLVKLKRWSIEELEKLKLEWSSKTPQQLPKSYIEVLGEFMI